MKKRKGVNIDDVLECLLKVKPKNVKKSNKGNSQKFINDKIEVSLTLRLIF